MYCYLIAFLVLFLPVVLVFAVALWIAAPQEWGIPQKVSIDIGQSTLNCLK